MSRVAKKLITLPTGVEMQYNHPSLTVKGGRGVMSIHLHKAIILKQENEFIGMEVAEGEGDLVENAAIAGTMRALVQNMIIGVSQGFERKLLLVGVGYRAQVQENVLNLTLGFSHPIQYAIPSDVTIEAPSQTEIIVRGVDKQRVGQVSADIRAFRPPEPYKGKGVRYSHEKIILKEGKKK